MPPPSPRLRSSREVPPSRSAQEPLDGPSATPIYDALYAEWLRSFKALPGDRHGEEDLGFTAFGSLPHGSSSYSSLNSLSSYTSYSAGAHSARQSGAQQGHTTTATAIWQMSGRQHSTGMHHIPAALPPAPRRGL
ncbi:hypothetical protein C4B68_31720 [Streptomyces dengpaensis]|uniref:Uncharacterized protein n=1 Tax=Streptomyces dengpaensis TaxID=2049881 RepID=A0ABN5IEG5_9ACTN|nr:hypothetical protein C4B68_31720 [Streptomyces dengpaensis]